MFWNVFSPSTYDTQLGYNVSSVVTMVLGKKRIFIYGLHLVSQKILATIFFSFFLPFPPSSLSSSGSSCSVILPHYLPGGPAESTERTASVAPGDPGPAGDRHTPWGTSANNFIFPD